MNMNKNKRILYFIFIIFSFFFIGKKVDATTCEYKSKNGTTTASYETIKEVKTNLVKSNEKITVIKYKGKKENKSSNTNKSINDYSITECYEYLSISIRNVPSGKRVNHYFSYKLGKNIDEIDGEDDNTVVLKLNGFDSTENSGDTTSNDESMCELKLSNQNYNNNINMDKLDLNLKSSYDITFKFITYQNNIRKFTVNYDSKTYGDNVQFSGADIIPVQTEITGATFTIDKNNIDDFFACKVSKSRFNIKKDNKTYTLFAEKRDDEDTSGSNGLEEWNQKKCSELSDSDCKKRQDCQMVGGTCSDAEIAKDPCNEKSIRQVLKFFGYLLMIAKFVVPFILIGFAVYDLYKSIIDKDEKALKTKLRMIMFRIIAGVTVFFIPDLVWVGFKYIEKSNITGDQYQVCAECVLKPSSNELCTVEDNSTNE